MITDNEQRERDFLALSQALQEKIWAMLNDPAGPPWARMPHVVAHGLGEVLLRVLDALSQADGNSQFAVQFLKALPQHLRQHGVTVSETTRH